MRFKELLPWSEHIRVMSYKLFFFCAPLFVVATYKEIFKATLKFTVALARLYYRSVYHFQRRREAAFDHSK